MAEDGKVNSGIAAAGADELANVGSSSNFVQTETVQVEQKDPEERAGTSPGGGHRKDEL